MWNSLLSTGELVQVVDGWRRFPKFNKRDTCIVKRNEKHKASNNFDLKLRHLGVSPQTYAVDPHFGTLNRPVRSEIFRKYLSSDIEEQPSFSQHRNCRHSTVSTSLFEQRTTKRPNYWSQSCLCMLCDRRKNPSCPNKRHPSNQWFGEWKCTYEV